jgi:hypothetical protein
LLPPQTEYKRVSAVVVAIGLGEELSRCVDGRLSARQAELAQASAETWTVALRPEKTEDLAMGREGIEPAALGSKVDLAGFARSRVRSQGGIARRSLVC